MNKLIILFIATLISLASTQNLDYDSWLNIELYHSLDGGDQFTLRGNISVTSLNTGSLSITQQPLTNEERLKFKDLAENNKLYRMKSIVKTPDSKKTEFLSSSRACSLAKSQLNDIIYISLDHYGSVIGITQKVFGNGNCQDLKKVNVDGLEEFNTDAFVKYMEMSPVIDTSSFIMKVEKERQARESGGDVKDNRGFFAKYWMYIVPVAILVLISGATNPSDGGAAR